MSTELETKTKNTVEFSKDTDSNIATKKNKTEKPNETVSLTRGTLDLIKEVVKETGCGNRYELLRIISDALTDKHGFESFALEHQLTRMRIDTTGKLLTAIDIYFFKYYKEEKTNA